LAFPADEMTLTFKFPENFSAAQHFSSPTGEEKMRKRITPERGGEACMFVLGALLSVVTVAALTVGVTELEPKQTPSQHAAR
jgi:hypothetical protein